MGDTIDLSIIGFDIKKIFRKLACCSFLSIASIGCFDAEARVTKEVAEAVLPYLMEAAGIEENIGPRNQDGKPYYLHNKIQAILDMIYTDEGQQQMVKWVQDGTFPTKLDGAGFKSAETYKDKAYRDASLASLFPCTTGTFTSFANHDSRLGKHVLADTTKMTRRLVSLLSLKQQGGKDFDGILHNIERSSASIDKSLSKIIFVLDICDEISQVIDVIKQALNIKEPKIRADVSKSEYMCRPISAIVADDGGDCVETLYRHLINIAIQDPKILNRIHIERLPVELQKYYDAHLSYTQKRSCDGFEITGRSESGLVSIKDHINWKKALSHVVPSSIDISSGSLFNIAKVLHYIAFYYEDRNISQVKASDTAGLLILIQDALNKLASLSKPNDIRFTVAEDNSTDNKSTPWVNQKIIIQDKHAMRQITIGICSKPHANHGHAEIVAITPTTTTNNQLM